MRTCAWCRGPIPPRARRDAIYCRKSCRQASHRFRRGYIPRPADVDRPLELAYADPPYPGKAGIYRDHPDYAGEVDHAELIGRLELDYPDGWALSTSAAALRDVWQLTPPGTRLAVWVRGVRRTRSALPLNAYEAVLYRGGRQVAGDDASSREDALVYGAGVRLTDPNRVTGAKPAEFAWWLFDLLGARPGDTLADLFPGSGGIGRAWTIYTSGRPLPDDPQLRLELGLEPSLLEPRPVDAILATA